MDNVSLSSTSSAATSSFPPLTSGHSKVKVFLNAAFVLMAVIGIVGNFVALRVITCSRQIRTCKSYVLFVNQCLIDGVFGVFTVVCVVCEYTVKSERMQHTTLDWMICTLLHSNVSMAITACGSGYNLSAMAVERTVSVVFPVFHRNRINNWTMVRVAAGAWILGVVLMLPMALFTNGITPQGRCHYWDGLDERYKLITAVTFNTSLSIAPFFIMLVSFVAMYARITSLKLRIRLTVVRVLASCVGVFFLCHALRNIFSILNRSNPSGRNWFREPVYIVSLVLIQSTSIMNPIVYAVQYKDYREELRRQWDTLWRYARSTSSNDPVQLQGEANSVSLGTITLNV